MTKEELNTLKNEPHIHYVYADKKGIVAELNLKQENKTIEVPVGSAGIIEDINENYMKICWDHYNFENHTIPELFSCPVSILDLKKLNLIRVHKYPQNVQTSV